MKYFGCRKCGAIHYEYEPLFDTHTRHKTRSGIMETPISPTVEVELREQGLIEKKHAGFRALVKQITVLWKEYVIESEYTDGTEYWDQFPLPEHIVEDFFLHRAKVLKKADPTRVPMNLPPDIPELEEEDTNGT